MRSSQTQVPYYEGDINPLVFGLDPETLPDIITNPEQRELFFKNSDFPNDLDKDKAEIGRLRPFGIHYYMVVRK